MTPKSKKNDISLHDALEKENTFALKTVSKFSHEMKKPLSIIRGLISHYENNPSVEKFNKISKEIDLEVTRAAKILDKMMKTFRKKVPSADAKITKVS